MFKYLSLVIFLLAQPILVKAETINNHFKSDVYQCAKKPYIMELSVTGNSDSSVTIQRMFKRADRNNYDRLAQWEFKADELNKEVTVNRSNGKPYYTFSGLLTDSPQMIALDRKGKPRTDCSLRLSPVASPTERYEAVFSQLENEKPTPAEAITLFKDKSELPPKELLPTLKQTAFIKKLKEENTAYWKRYNTVSIEAAADTKNTSIISGIAKLSYLQNNNSVFNWHNKLLISAQNTHSLALFNSGSSPEKMRVTDQTEFCSRLSYKIRIHDWRNYLETVSGLPVEFWTNEIAESYLETAKSCEKPEHFTKTMSKQWPSIETQNQAFKDLVKLRDDFDTMDITLDTLKEKNWLTVDSKTINNFYKKGFANKEVTNFLATAIEKQSAIAMNKIPKVLSEKIAEDLPYDQYTLFCQEQRRHIGISHFSKLQTEIFKQCDELVAEKLKEKLVKEVQDSRDEFLAREGTTTDLIETKGYDLRKSLPKLNFYSGSFKTAKDAIEAEITDAESKIEPVYQKALTTSLEEIKQAFTNAKPFTDSENIPTKLCQQFNSDNYFLSKSRLSPVQNLCKELQKDFLIKKEVVACDRIWENFDVPKEVQAGTLSLSDFFGGTKSIKIRKVMCDSAKKKHRLNIEYDKGWFSSNYKLSREATISGVDVKFSVNLVEPKNTGTEWTVAEPEVIPDTFLDIEKLKSSSSNELLSCLFFLEGCHKQ